MGSIQDRAALYLKHIAERFALATGGIKPQFPLVNPKLCRAFDASVTETMTEIRDAAPREFPTAMIGVMIRLCQAIVDPPAETFRSLRQPAIISRTLAYELIDRLQAELPPTLGFALGQVGRIVTEAGTLQDKTRLNDSITGFHLRLAGAKAMQELTGLIEQIWTKRYPQHPDMMKAL